MVNLGTVQNLVVTSTSLANCDVLQDGCTSDMVLIKALLIHLNANPLIHPKLVPS